MLQILLAMLLTLALPPQERNNVAVCLTAEEKDLYDIINEYRKTKKLPPIPFSASLTKVAQAHAKDLAHHYHFDRENKCNPHSWSDNGSWTSCCYTNDHKQAQCMWDKPQEIAGYESPGYEIAYYSSKGATAEEGLAGWKKSSGHNPLLINTGIWKPVSWKAIGIGIYEQYAVVWFGQLAENSQIKTCE